MRNFNYTPSGHVEQDHDGYTVWTDWTPVGNSKPLDRPRTTGISTGRDKRLALRLVEAINAGKVFSGMQVRTDIDGNTYVGATSLVHGRYLRSDLERIGA
jgi:hypothetical protein